MYGRHIIWLGERVLTTYSTSREVWAMVGQWKKCVRTFHRAHPALIADILVIDINKPVNWGQPKGKVVEESSPTLTKNVHDGPVHRGDMVELTDPVW